MRGGEGARLKLENGVLGPNEKNLDWPVQTVQSHWRFLSQNLVDHGVVISICIWAFFFFNEV